MLPQQVLRLLPLEAFPASQKAAVVKHIGRLWIQGPVVPLPGVPWLPGYLHKTVVQGQVVSDGVLPGGELFPVVRESAADEIADLAEREALLGALQDGHGD